MLYRAITWRAPKVRRMDNERRGTMCPRLPKAWTKLWFDCRRVGLKNWIAGRTVLPFESSPLCHWHGKLLIVRINWIFTFRLLPAVKRREAKLLRYQAVHDALRKRIVRQRQLPKKRGPKPKKSPVAHSQRNEWLKQSHSHKVCHSNDLIALFAFEVFHHKSIFFPSFIIRCFIENRSQHS